MHANLNADPEAAPDLLNIFHTTTPINPSAWSTSFAILFAIITSNNIHI
jgi:hypothetical protein